MKIDKHLLLIIAAIIIGGIVCYLFSGFIGTLVGAMLGGPALVKKIGAARAVADDAQRRQKFSEAQSKHLGEDERKAHDEAVNIANKPQPPPDTNLPSGFKDEDISSR